MCFKEKAWRDVVNPQYSMNSIGRAYVKGKCAGCGGGISTILKRADTPADLLAKIEKFKANKAANKPARKTGGAQRKSRAKKPAAPRKSKRAAPRKSKRAAKKSAPRKSARGRK